LTSLLETYRGRTLPLAQPGFGLPEVYEALARVVGRNVPASPAEATYVAQWLSRFGPFDPDAFQTNLDKVVHKLGSGRPLSQILSALEARIQPKEKS
jgi:hypothetical protein